MTEQPEIDWDLIVYDYDPDTRRITVHNWLTYEVPCPPLQLALVPNAEDVLNPYIQTLTRRLIDLANEKLREQEGTH